MRTTTTTTTLDQLNVEARQLADAIQRGRTDGRTRETARLSASDVNAIAKGRLCASALDADAIAIASDLVRTLRTMAR